MDAETQPVQQGGFLVACVLLILQQEPREADELRELVGAFGFHRQIGGLDAVLRSLEDDRLVRAVGQAGSEECACRWLQLTAGGQEWLAARQHALAEPARLLGRFLDRYAAPLATAPDGDGGATSLSEVSEQR